MRTIMLLFDVFHQFLCSNPVLRRNKRLMLSNRYDPIIDRLPIRELSKLRIKECGIFVFVFYMVGFIITT